eukprot:5087032-Pyramimonas_sp.AAC.2
MLAPSDWSLDMLSPSICPCRALRGLVTTVPADGFPCRGLEVAFELTGITAVCQYHALLIEPGLDPGVLEQLVDLLDKLVIRAVLSPVVCQEGVVNAPHLVATGSIPLKNTFPLTLKQILAQRIRKCPGYPGVQAATNSGRHVIL